MNPVLGTITADDIQTEQGLTRRRFRIPLFVKNTDTNTIDIRTFEARVYVDFSIDGRPATQGGGQYVSELVAERVPAAFGAGDNNRVSLIWSLTDEEIAAIENARADRDVRLNVETSFVGADRPHGTSLAVPVSVSMQITDARSQSTQYVVCTIAKSSWEALLSRVSYSRPAINAQEIQQLIVEARAAKMEAEMAAKGAKEAASFTVVSGLAQAYSEECTALRSRSRIWALISAGVAGCGAFLMYAYATESLHGSLSAAATALRAVIIAAIFGALTLCIRIYESYLHLEVVNRHRVNIGRTFEAFKNAQPTERSKEIMSAITAEHMLAFGKSGFAPKDSPNQGPLPGVTELIKAIAEKKNP